MLRTSLGTTSSNRQDCNVLVHWIQLVSIFQPGYAGCVLQNGRTQETKYFVSICVSDLSQEKDYREFCATHVYHLLGMKT